MKVCFALLRRDLMLIKMNMVKRVGILFLVSLTVNLLSVLQGQAWFLQESLMGIEAAIFRENPLSFPAGWMLISISGILISFDFVRSDLYEHCAGIIVRVKRSYFWLSKVLAGLILSMALLVLYTLTYGAADLLYFFQQEKWLIGAGQWCRICPYLLGGIFFGYCVFQLTVMVFREAVGIIATLVCFCAGLASESLCYPVNHMMAARSLMFNPLGSASPGASLLYVCGMILFMSFAGAALIGRIDVFSRKESE